MRLRGEGKMAKRTEVKTKDTKAEMAEEEAKEEYKLVKETGYRAECTGVVNRRTHRGTSRAGRRRCTATWRSTKATSKKGWD